MKIIKKGIFILAISFSVFSSEIDAEIIDNIDFYMNIHLLEGDEDKVELFLDDEYSEVLKVQLKSKITQDEK